VGWLFVFVGGWGGVFGFFRVVGVWRLFFGGVGLMGCCFLVLGFFLGFCFLVGGCGVGFYLHFFLGLGGLGLWGFGGGGRVVCLWYLWGL